MSVKNEKLLLTVEVANKRITETADKIVALKNEIKELKQEQKNANIQLEKGEITQKEYNSIISKTTVGLNKTNATLREENQTLKTHSTFVNSAEHSYNKLNAELTILRTKQKSGAIIDKTHIERIKELDAKLKGADATMGNFQRHVGHYQNALKGVKAGFMSASIAITAVVVGVTSVLRAMNSMVEGYKKQIEAEKKLTVIMKERTGATDEQIHSILNLTSVQQKNGVVGDEIQLAGAQQLATFVHQTDSINMLIPAMNNLLVQQKGVNGTQQDATNIANLMGKALDGNVGALTRVGISLTEEQKKLLKAGDEQQRVALLAQIITDNVGNMNEEFAKTDIGKLQQVKNNMGDVFENLGHVILPMLVQITSLIGVVVAGFGKIVDKISLTTGINNSFSDSVAKVNFEIDKQSIHLGALLAVAYNENESLINRKKAMDEINRISPEYLGSINLQTTSYVEAKKAVDKYITSLQKQLYIEIATQKTRDLLQKKMAIEQALFDAKIKDIELNKKTDAFTDNREFNQVGGTSTLNWQQVKQMGSALKQQQIEQNIRDYNIALKDIQKQLDLFDVFMKDTYGIDLNEETPITGGGGTGGTGGTGGGTSVVTPVSDGIKLNKEGVDSEVFTDQKVLDTKLVNITTFNNKRLDLENSYYEELARLANKELADDKERKQNKLDTIEDFALNAGTIMGQLASGGKAHTEEYLKDMIIMTLEAVKKMVLIYEAQILAKQLADKGFLGLATTAVLTGITHGVFAGIESRVRDFSSSKETVKGFANGGIISNGASIYRSNGDDVLITAKKGEVILNEYQQSLIGYNNLKAIGIQGFSTGGIVGNNALREASQQNEIKTVLVVRDLENIQNQKINELNFSRI